MRIAILVGLLFLSACTATTNTTDTNKTPTTAPTTTTPTVKENHTVATPTFGSWKTQVEIFADFQCPACIVFSENVGPIFEEYAASGKLTITFRQYPLEMHKNAKSDAIAALCSAEQWKYMDYKKGLYSLEREKAGKSVTDAERVSLAKEKGLDETKFSSCLSSRAYEKQVESDIALGDSKWVNATPTIYIDGMKVDMSLFRDLNGFKTFLENRIK